MADPVPAVGAADYCINGVKVYTAASSPELVETVPRW